MSIEDINTYNEIIKELNRPVPKFDSFDSLGKSIIESKPVKKAKTEEQKAKDKANTKQSVEDTIEELENIELETYQDYKDAVRQIRDAQNKLQKLINEDRITETEKNELTEKLKQLNDIISGRVQEQLKGVESKVKSEAKKQQAKVDKTKFDSARQPFIQQFLNTDVDNLSIKEAELYAQIAEGLNEGFVNSEMYDFIKEQNQKQKEQKYQEAFEFISESVKQDKLVLGITKKIPISELDATQIADKLKLKDAENWGDVFNTKGNEEVYTEMFAPIQKAFNEFIADFNEDGTKYLEAANQNTLSEKTALVLYMKQRQHQSNQTKTKDGLKNWEDLPSELKDHFKASMLNNIDKDYSDSEVKNIEKVYDSLPKTAEGNLDLKATYKGFTSSQKKLLEVLDEMFAKNQGKAEVVTESRGSTFNKVINFIPNQVRQLKVGKDAKEAGMEIDDLIASKPAGATKRTGTSYERTKEIYASEYDLDTIMTLYLKDLNRDYHLTMPVQEVFNALNTVKGPAKEGTLARAVQLAIKDRIINQFRTRYYSESTGYNRFVNDLLSIIRAKYLGTPLRIIPDFTANTIKILVGNPKAALYVKVALDARITDIINKTGSALADPKANAFASELAAKSVLKSSKNRFLRLPEKGLKISKKATELSYGIGDRYPARLNWTAEFYSQFKELTGSEFDIDKYGSDPEYSQKNEEAINTASSMANIKVSELNNLKSSLSAATMIKMLPFAEKSKISKEANIAKLFNFLSDYSRKEAYIFWRSLKDLSNLQNKAEATKNIARITASNLTYAKMTSLIATAIMALMTDDDEEKELLWENERENNVKAVNNTIMNLLTGGYSNQAKAIIAPLIAGLDPTFKGNSDYDKVRDFALDGLYTEPLKDYGSKEYYIEQIPAVGDFAADLVGTSDNLLTAMGKAYNGEPLTEEEKAATDVMFLLGKSLQFLPNPVTPTVNKLEKISKRYDKIMDPTRSKEFTESVEKLEQEIEKVAKKFGQAAADTYGARLTAEDRKALEKKIIKNLKSSEASYNMLKQSKKAYDTQKQVVEDLEYILDNYTEEDYKAIAGDDWKAFKIKTKEKLKQEQEIFKNGAKRLRENYKSIYEEFFK